MWPGASRSLNYGGHGEMAGMVGLRDVFVVAHHHHHPAASSFHHQNDVVMPDLHGVGVGVIPLLTAAPCDNSGINLAGNRSRGGGGGIQLWPPQDHHYNMKKQAVPEISVAHAASGHGGGGGNASSGGGATMTCQDCGNQAKKDCTHRSGATSGSKKPRLIGSQTTTTSHTSTSNTTPPRSFDTSSSHQDASFKETLPGQVRAPAVFKCVRVTAVDEGDGGDSQILAIVGPSGTGKSTLLRVIAGRVEDPGFDPGTVSINDHPMTSPSQLRKICGFVAQEDNLLPLLTVEETLMFSAKFRLKGMAERDRHVRVQSLMQELENRGISGGERKRVSIGVDMIHNPPILMLDEPTSGLDSTSALQVIQLLSLMAKSKQRIVILSIHQPSYRILQYISRFWKVIYRTKQLFLARTLQALVGGFGLGSVYIKVRKLDEGGVAERLGLFAFSLSFLLSSTVEALPIYLQERCVLMKEASRGAYKISSYMLANTLVFLPFLFVVSLLFAVPVYWIVGLNPTLSAFAFFTLVVWLIVLMASSLVLFLSAVSSDFISGNSLICTVLGAFFLFSGYFIPKESIPKYWMFMYYVSLYRYPLDSLLTNEYWNVRDKCFSKGAEADYCLLTGFDVLKSRGLEKDTRWVNVAIMIGFFVLYRVLCWVILARKASKATI
ncbi:ABC transporter G family member 23 [Senna tora]|uniref:ABC transporter G family member 23 n=1 Tax=Senna tora TaxID=362788 RepID=A0A834WW18_9FABA|nr:ABC transporter G family member 23 [Senna tora]